MGKQEKKTRQRKPRQSKKFVGVVVKEFIKRGETFKVGDSYNAIDEGSYKYLITSGFIASKK